MRLLSDGGLLLRGAAINLPFGVRAGADDNIYIASGAALGLNTGVWLYAVNDSNDGAMPINFFGGVYRFHSAGAVAIDNVSPAGGHPSIGALIVAGGAGIGEALTVGDKVQVAAPTGTAYGQYDGGFSVRGRHASFEWGHVNPAGYGATLGFHIAVGTPYIAFNAGPGSTNDTFKTLGIKGSLILSDHFGGLVFAQAADANADNQAASQIATLTSAGLHVLAATPSTSRTNGALTVDGGGGFIGAVNAEKLSATKQWGFETSSSSLNVADGDEEDLEAGMGLALIVDFVGGGCALYLIVAGEVILVAANGANALDATSTPTAGRAGLSYNFATEHYRIKNNKGTGASYRILGWRLF
jgi:hypothetical protein